MWLVSHVLSITHLSQWLTHNEERIWWSERGRPVILQCLCRTPLSEACGQSRKVQSTGKNINCALANHTNNLGSSHINKDCKTGEMCTGALNSGRISIPGHTQSGHTINWPATIAETVYWRDNVTKLPQNMCQYLLEKSQKAHLGECSVLFYMWRKSEVSGFYPSAQWTNQVYNKCNYDRIIPKIRSVCSMTLAGNHKGLWSCAIAVCRDRGFIQF